MVRLVSPVFPSASPSPAHSGLWRHLASLSYGLTSLAGQVEQQSRTCMQLLSIPVLPSSLIIVSSPCLLCANALYYESTKETGIPLFQCAHVSYVMHRAFWDTPPCLRSLIHFPAPNDTDKYAQCQCLRSTVALARHIPARTAKTCLQDASHTT